MINYSKLVLWTETKLLLNINIIYDYFAEINLQAQLLHEARDFQGDSLKLCAYRCFLKKYKTQKLCWENLVNLFYSLVSHLGDEGKQMSGRVKLYHLFERMITQDYANDDVVFFLYLKCIIDSLLGESSLADLCRCSIDSRQLGLFLDRLCNSDHELHVDYQKDITQRFLKGSGRVSVLSLAEYVLEDFRYKKRQIYCQKNDRHGMELTQAHSKMVVTETRNRHIADELSLQSLDISLSLK